MSKNTREPSIGMAVFLTALLLFISIAINPALPNLITLAIFLAAGIVIPFSNLYLTWWIYTLGGRMSIPPAHKWLTQALKIKTKTISPADLAALGVLGISLGQTIYYGYFKYHTSQILYFFQILLPILTFGLALTLGTALRRKQFLSPAS